MKKVVDAMKKRGIEINDHNYKVDGVLDMDATWNMVQN